jgi:CRISPR-associated protein Cmr1
VTPILGGGSIPGESDPEGLRGPSLRGHLRFWWRATAGARSASPADLLQRETALFGGLVPDAVRSAVEVRVQRGPGEPSFPVAGSGPSDLDDLKYAIWPALQGPAEARPSWRLPGEVFEVRVRAPADRIEELRVALRAWILFGGIGGRTRRGLGAITVDGDTDARAAWLPTALTRAALAAAFGGGDPLQAIPARTATEMPVLAGAGLLTAAQPAAGSDPARSAWGTSIGWLQRFRQGEGASSRDPRAARERGADSERPGRSNWPEPDKIRLHFKTHPPEHAPRHNRIPVWPRAALGLPIQVRFQGRKRRQQQANGGFFQPAEPGPSELVWADAVDGSLHDRLASPLILKPIGLADGRFVAAALWLERAYPEHGRVGLRAGPSILAPAAFDDLVAPGDVPPLAMLADPRVGACPPGRRMRRAFFLSVARDGGAQITEVAP